MARRVVALAVVALAFVGPAPRPGCASTDGPQFRCYLAGLPATR